DGSITWDEFLSHLLLEFRLKGTAALNSQPLELPIVDPPKLIQSRHPYAICKIILYTDISIQNESSRMSSCNYLTASKDGTINYWSTDFVHQRQVKAINISLKVSRTMIIDMIAMPDVRMICVTSSERELRFYDTTINKFELRMRIHSFRVAVVCMSYYFSENSSDKSCIIMGDTSGSINVIRFNRMDNNPFKQRPDCDVFEIHYESALKELLLTGGPDSLIRAWNPFVADRASAIFQGHQSPICAIIIHNSAEKAYTLSKDKCIKIWDIETQICIQTYNQLPSEVSEYTSLSSVYNPVTHQLIIASMMIAVVVCEKTIDKDKSDGENSYIIMWDPWRGRCIYVIRNAHTEMYLGKLRAIPISAATFDPCNQLLATGAKDGSIKVWSYSSGTCLKTMMINQKW
ncbi:GSCOCG00005990001-RA-CDS, partial [Cotesia congregata]